MAMTVTAPLAPCLYTEARLNIEPTYANSTLHIPTEGPSSFFSRKRSRADDTLADADEDAYASHPSSSVARTGTHDASSGACSRSANCCTSRVST
jgi:hypothetical protein